jgi:hypothetical protein
MCLDGQGPIKGGPGWAAWSQTPTAARRLPTAVSGIRIAPETESPGPPRHPTASGLGGNKRTALKESS